MTRNCDNCGKEYTAKDADVKRGWGLCCSKSCAAAKREKSKTGYNPERVAANNIKRALWNEKGIDENEYGIYRGARTSEGYKVYGETAIDEYGNPVYRVQPEGDDPSDDEYWNDKDY